MLATEAVHDGRSSEEMSLLLKERWSLIQKGTERKRIKLRNFSILVDNQIHCKVEGSQLVFQSISSN